MTRSLFMAFALIAYAIFFATFLYLIAFVGNLPGVPLTVDRGPDSAIGMAIVIVALIALFGIQHSVMARQRFKRAWTKIVPKHAERCVYVIATSVTLIVLFLAWRPVDGLVWQVTQPLLAYPLWGLFALGWLIVLTSTFLINHFELFGLQQAWFNLRNRAAAAPQFRQLFFYRFVRHPLYSGFFLAFWATPVMTFGHLLLAVGMSTYMLIAIGFEERDLVGLFGRDYEQYRKQVGMLTPRFGRRPATPAESA